jgi:ABC-type sugar transport system permease subunit
MDPITLFALANGAVAAVKKGCQLYKDIKGAAGDVKAVLKDLDEQFNKAHPPEKPASLEARNQFVKEKNLIIELNKRDGETAGIYTELGEHLGTYYDNYYKCMAIFEEEEKHSQHEIYEGDASLGKRALQRVLMRKQLEQMGTELREIMVYQSPPELGALHSEVEEMMEKMGAQQKVLIARQMREDHVRAVRRRRRMDAVWANAIWGVAAVVIALSIGLMMALLVQDRIEKYPQLGTGIVPKSERQRQLEAEPKKYLGR